MPVTVKVADHLARSWRADDHGVQSAQELLEDVNPYALERKKSKEILQSSFTKFDSANPIKNQNNGLVEAVIRAYAGHFHLRIRPEDVWFNILSQLTFYIDKHAEELRSFFVAHEGQKKLKVATGGTRHTVNWDDLAVQMGAKIKENVNDPDLHDWVMPDFSTTTSSDKVVASILFMGAMKNYFNYDFQIVCGVPSVTLLGTRADWESILARLEKIPQLGAEPKQFYTLLKPIITRFIKTFDAPDSRSVRRFWQKMVHQDRYEVCGPPYVSGWIAAFCFWDKDGDSLHARYGTKSVYKSLKSLVGVSYLSLDGAKYHHITESDIPTSRTAVPVTVDDNGTKFEATMVAGVVGYQLSSSGGPVEAREDEAASTLDTIQPFSGWWMYLNEDAPKGEDVQKQAARAANNDPAASVAIANEKEEDIQNSKNDHATSMAVLPEKEEIQAPKNDLPAIAHQPPASTEILAK